MNNPTITILLIILALLFLFLLFWEEFRPWVSPMCRSEKIVRALKIGLYLMVFLYSVLTIIDVSSTSAPFSKWNAISYLGLLVCVLPFSVVGAIGSYLNFGVRDFYQKTLTRIFQKKQSGK